MNTNKDHSQARFKVLGILFGVMLLSVASGDVAHAQATSSGQGVDCSSKPCGGS